MVESRRKQKIVLSRMKLLDISFRVTHHSVICYHDEFGVSRLIGCQV